MRYLIMLIMVIIIFKMWSSQEHQNNLKNNSKVEVQLVNDYNY